MADPEVPAPHEAASRRADAPPAIVRTADGRPVTSLDALLATCGVSTATWLPDVHHRRPDRPHVRAGTTAPWGSSAFARIGDQQCPRCLGPLDACTSARTQLPSWMCSACGWTLTAFLQAYQTATAQAERVADRRRLVRALGITLGVCLLLACVRIGWALQHAIGPLTHR